MRVKPQEPRGQGAFRKPHEGRGGLGFLLPQPAQLWVSAQRGGCVSSAGLAAVPGRGCLRRCAEKDSETRRTTCCLAVSTLGEGGTVGASGDSHL